jgi:hypothetical protein
LIRHYFHCRHYFLSMTPLRHYFRRAFIDASCHAITPLPDYAAALMPFSPPLRYVSPLILLLILLMLMHAIIFDAAAAIAAATRCRCRHYAIFDAAITPLILFHYFAIFRYADAMLPRRHFAFAADFAIPRCR